MDDLTQTAEKPRFDAESIATFILDEANHVISKRVKKSNKSWNINEAKQQIVARNKLGIEWHYAVIEANNNPKNAVKPDKIKVRDIAVNKDTGEITVTKYKGVEAKTNNLAAPYWKDDDVGGYVCNLNYGHTTVFPGPVPMKDVKNDSDADAFMESVFTQLLTTDSFDKWVNEARKRLRGSFDGISKDDLESQEVTN